MTAIVNLTDPLQRGDTLSFELNWDNGAQVPLPLDMRGKPIVFTINLSNFQEDAEALESVWPGVDFKCILCDSEI